MKSVLAISFLMCCTLGSSAQKVRLIDDTSTFLCIADSLSDVLIENLRKQKVDSVISMFYDYDNGRVEKAFQMIIWTVEGKSQIRKIKGCDNITIDTTYAVELRPILAFIAKTKFKALTEPIKSLITHSHSMGYFTSVELGKGKFEINVRDYNLRKTKANKEAQGDARVKLINMLIQL